MAQRANLLTGPLIAGLSLPNSNKFHSLKGYEAEIDDGLSGRKRRTEAAPGGFGAVVTPVGSRSYVLNYIVSGKERRITLGKCSVHAPAEAIEWARGLRRRLDTEAGFDPLVEKQAVPTQDTTLGELFGQWVAARKEKSTSQRSAFKRHILPAVLTRFKPRPLRDVVFKELRKPDIAELHRAIRENGGDVIADRGVRYLGAVLNWQAANNEEDWRAPDLPRPVHDEEASERDHTLSDDDIRALWPVWETAGRNGQLARLLLLTGCRRNEIADAEWSEADLEGATLHIPSGRYKTRRATTIALSEPAVAILSGISEAGRRPDGRVFATWSFARAKNELDKLCRREPDWHFHDLRRTAGSIMYAEGVSAEDCDEVLGHVRRKVTRVYLRDRNRGGDFMSRKRRAVDTLARAIERIVNPEPAKVVPLRAAV